MYDVIVVGARCAGSPTAMLLARRGLRVLLVERATFPSDSMRNHYILHRGVVQLHRWELLERVAASNCPPVRKHTVDLGDFPLAGYPPPGDGVDAEYAPRRVVLDKILADAAVEAGAELREGFSVQEILRDGPDSDRVTGIRGRGRNGAMVTERARITVGADGLHSIVARTVEAPRYNEVPTRTFGYFSYWSGLLVEGLEIYFREGRMLLAFPTNDGLACVAAQGPVGEFQRFRADIERNFDRALDAAPALAGRVRAGRREERFYGTAELPNFFRKPYGPGWALVGDAGYHKDPITANGISDAFRDAELLCDAIVAGLGGDRPFDETLAEYERRRNDAAAASYEWTCQAAALGPAPADALALRAALRGNQAETDRFFGVGMGTVPGEQFFSPENMQRIQGRVSQAERGGAATAGAGVDGAPALE
jgi:flavin-dependent dehydrogenase